jgi:hypothetical protein
MGDSGGRLLLCHWPTVVSIQRLAYGFLMPWQHCNNSISDDSRCPSCGANKAAWTLKLDSTRLFTLGKTWDGDPSQAQVLKAAAQAGAAVCEQCEKAKQEGQQDQQQAGQ